MDLKLILVFALINNIYAAKKCIVVLDRGDEYIECKNIVSLASIISEWQPSWETLRVVNEREYKLLIAGKVLSPV